MFQFIKKLFGFGKSEKLRIKEISDKIKRFADRFRNAEETTGAEIADYYSERILQCSRLEQAEALEKEFYNELNKKGIKMNNNTDEGDSNYYHSSGSSHHHHTSSDNNDFATGYVASEMIHSMDNNSNDSQNSDGEFGGAGASESWDEENNTDNS